MKKFIGYYKNIVSHDLCDKIMDYCDNVKPLKPSTYSNHKGEVDSSDERVKMAFNFKNGNKKIS